ncbi:7347_t:CDS:2 [Racocetra persica]|uniref:7347_t:CDS:1 n=1 Tax=Racocetra persica TaxID=160502 RepID=A0ACA9N8Y7_9GLOM|nr:7347_t:CDS:2 [Racocetra persica]
MEKKFIHKFSKTSRRYDYPLFVFGKNELPPITPINNPWIWFGMTLAEDNPIEKTNFDTLVMPFLKEIDKYEEVLQSSHQQKTWTLDNSKLAFWLR